MAESSKSEDKHGENAILRAPSFTDSQARNDPTGSFGPGPVPTNMRPRKRFILCFDGTGNKFQGNSGDSNILKIYSMLPRTMRDQFHYYQPGIGTYVTTASLSHTSWYSRLRSWYIKSKDSAIGTSFDQHVMGGYKFLMRYYEPGDDIYLFGFSRGAYTARFLAEMLDHVGLLSAGNEELARFAWKTFARWQSRRGGSEKDEKTKQEQFEYMKAFRETFSRPVRRIRFMGLFDTVNSVPRFENAWMQRSKFPYTARSSAKVIRHAVAIDERRAKFRQDLLSEGHQHRVESHRGRHLHRKPSLPKERDNHLAPGSAGSGPPKPDRFYRRRSRSTATRSRRLSSVSANSDIACSVCEEDRDSDSDEDEPQDILELWFPGDHADIGGGWPPDLPEGYSASHVPLVWMVREVEKAGLTFDEVAMRKYCCYDDSADMSFNASGPSSTVPRLEVTASPSEEKPSVSLPAEQESEYTKVWNLAATKARTHDMLSFGQGWPASKVLPWKIMEYLPFRRMDLQPDGSWKPIRWPLPRGEVRDIPADALVHSVALKRMETNSAYRPGNLIVGGGGRGIRKAPPEAGQGDWEVIGQMGDAVREFVRKKAKSQNGAKAVMASHH